MLLQTVNPRHIMSLGFVRSFSLTGTMLALLAIPLLGGDDFMGDYNGRWVSPPKTYRFVDAGCQAQVIALGNDRYQVQLAIILGLRAPWFFVAEGTAADGTLTFETSDARGTVRDGRMTGEMRHDEEWVKFELIKFLRSSPSLGRVAPAGATVLFDGKDLSGWRLREVEGPANWILVEEGAMEVLPREPGQKKANNIVSTATFTDVFVHLEFKLAFMPESRKQARSNSGVFLNDHHEVQILDSYGLDGRWDEAGALYKVSPPRVNMCLPPGEWQTYDIIYRAPRYDRDGSMTEPARMTVYHNGVCVQHEQPFISPLRTERQPPPGPHPLHLQDHRDPVRFRNIWAIDLAGGGQVPDYVRSLAR